MARYEHLTIYRDALNLAVHFEKNGRQFLRRASCPTPFESRFARSKSFLTILCRYHKYTLGTELRNASRHAVKLVIHANNQPENDGVSYCKIIF